MPNGTFISALASGEAWGVTRRLITEQYHLETVVASHDALRQNFSENTDLSEILFIARKLIPGEKPGETTYINLWRNPTSIHEALAKLDRDPTRAAIDDAICSVLDLPDLNKMRELMAREPGLTGKPINYLTQERVSFLNDELVDTPLTFS